MGSRKKRRENFQLPCFNTRQQAKLLNLLLLLIVLLLSCFTIFYIAANPSAVEAKFAQNNTAVEEEAGAVVVPVIRNGNIFLASVLQ